MSAVPPDRPDAPAVVTWRGKELVRWARRYYGEFVRYENRSFSNDISYSVDAGRAWIRLYDLDDGSGHCFDGLGVDEQAALDDAAAKMRAWLQMLLRDLSGVP